MRAHRAVHVAECPIFEPRRGTVEWVTDGRSQDAAKACPGDERPGERERREDAYAGYEERLHVAREVARSQRDRQRDEYGALEYEGRV
jgi:hypothetical protein